MMHHDGGSMLCLSASVHAFSMPFCCICRSYNAVPVVSDASNGGEDERAWVFTIVAARGGS